MADKPTKPEDDKPGNASKSIIRRHGRGMASKRAFDIKPVNASPASATSRPVVTGNQPAHSDPTLRRHGTTSLTPLQPQAPTPTTTPASSPVPPAPGAASSPVPATQPAPTATPTPTAPAPAPAAPVAATAPTPAPAPVATSTPATPLPPSPIPEVTAPPAMMDDHELDELELANLTGVHGIVDKKAPAAVAPGEVAAPAMPQVAKKDMHQTPQQAMKLAAALRDLKRHPVAPPSDKPVVVVHRHQYLRNLGLFLAFLFGGLVIGVIALYLAADAGLVPIPIQPVTNFF